MAWRDELPATGAKPYHEQMRDAADTWEGDVNSKVTGKQDAADLDTDVAANVANGASATGSAVTAQIGALAQPLDSDLTAIAALSTTAFGRSLLTLADAGALNQASASGIFLGTSDLNTITSPGIYEQMTTADGTLARNYPREGVSGPLEVFAVSASNLLQRLTPRNVVGGGAAQGFWQRRASAGTWGPWVFIPSQRIDNTGGATRVYTWNDATGEEMLSGPIRGTGVPEGVVAAPVGTKYIDLAKTVGAREWIKDSGTGSTGWVVTVGDTGWVSLITWDASGAYTKGEPLGTGWEPMSGLAGWVSVRRTTTHAMVDISRVTATTGNPPSSIATIPPGFRPSNLTRTVIGRGGANTIALQQFSANVSRASSSSIPSGFTVDQGTILTAPVDPGTAWPTTAP